MNDPQGLIDDILARAAHDLRSPLHVIVGYAELLKMSILAQESYDKKWIEYLDCIVHSVLYSSHIADDIVALYRGDDSIAYSSEGEQQYSESLGIVLQHAVDAARQLPAAQGLKFNLSIAPECADLALYRPHRLQRMAQNILNNAIQVSPEKGQIDVDVRMNANQVCVCFIDDGHGIDMDSERILRSHDASASHLGMRIVSQLVQRLGGTVVWSSQPKSTVQINLPLSALVSDQA